MIRKKCLKFPVWRLPQIPLNKDSFSLCWEKNKQANVGRETWCSTIRVCIPILISENGTGAFFLHIHSHSISSSKGIFPKQHVAQVSHFPTNTTCIHSKAHWTGVSTSLAPGTGDVSYPWSSFSRSGSSMLTACFTQLCWLLIIANTQSKSCFVEIFWPSQNQHIFKTTNFYTWKVSLPFLKVNSYPWPKAPTNIGHV